MKGAIVTLGAIIILGTLFGGDPAEAVTGRISCAAPGRPAQCQEIEETILASTIRVTFESWIVYLEGVGYVEIQADGHATVKGGRYLVTHNHYQTISPAVLKDKALAPAITLTLYRANGQRLLSAPADALANIIEDGETLILDFGQDFFSELGIPSAEMVVGERLVLEPGMELAQIDWDEATAHVDWVRVDAVLSDGGEHMLILDNCVMPGASGGGVYLNGTHIANNFSRSTDCQMDSGDGLLHYTRAALNSPRIADGQ